MNTSSSFFDTVKCIILPSKLLSQLHMSSYLKLYNFWSFEWKKAFNEIDLKHCENSDEFCRHEEVIALFYEGEPIACLLIDQFNLNNIAHKNHSYFNHFPILIYDQYKKLSLQNSVMTVGYLAVHKNFRYIPFLADALLGIVVKRFLMSNNKLLIGYTRNSRKVNRLTYRLGAKFLAKDISVYGELSDFVYFDHSSATVLKNHRANRLIEKLWQEKIFVPSLNIQNDNKGSQNETANELPNSL